MTKTYKGHTIVKQSVGTQGWNVCDKSGKCIKTGISTLADAKEWITMQIDMQEMRGSAQ